MHILTLFDIDVLTFPLKMSTSSQAAPVIGQRTVIPEQALCFRKPSLEWPEREDDYIGSDALEEERRPD